MIESTTVVRAIVSRLTHVRTARVGALTLAAFVIGTACSKSETFVCERQQVNATRTQITQLPSRSYKAKDAASAEVDCISDSSSGALTGECSCSPKSSSNSIPTAP